MCLILNANVRHFTSSIKNTFKIDVSYVDTFRKDAHLKANTDKFTRTFTTPHGFIIIDVSEDTHDISNKIRFKNASVSSKQENNYKLSWSIQKHNN